MAELSMDETAMISLYIRLKDPDDHAMVDKIARAFKETLGMVRTRFLGICSLKISRLRQTY